MIKKPLRIYAKSLSDALAPSKKKIDCSADLRRICEASAFIAEVPIVCQIFARKAGWGGGARTMATKKEGKGGKRGSRTGGRLVHRSMRCCGCGCGCACVCD